ncbi:hypothetical protein [Streptomyces sp. NPDC088725]|uniref:hypothetical protein n=1 Tax=Streptomyces sp. NPDC088725 TaxID=3365873 RepID=UPI003819F017
MSSRRVDSSTGSTAIIVLDGQSLRAADVVRPARGAAHPVPGIDGIKRPEPAWNGAREPATSGRVCECSAGVGANRAESVAATGTATGTATGMVTGAATGTAPRPHTDPTRGIA